MLIQEKVLPDQHVIQRIDVSSPKSSAPFRSFFGAGIECTTAKTSKGIRLNAIRDTQHNRFCRRDFRLIKELELNIRTIRLTFMYDEIARNPGKYDFRLADEMLSIAADEGIQLIMDFMHFGYPDWLDIFSDDFPKWFMDYAVHCTRRLAKYYPSGRIPVVLINEMSFLAWFAGEVGIWMPGTKGQGARLKRQLVRAVNMATPAIRSECSRVWVVQCDPYMKRTAKCPRNKRAIEEAERFNNHDQFESLRMVRGELCPELGGRPDNVDCFGAHIYYRCDEWVIIDPNDPAKFTGRGIRWRGRRRTPVSILLKQLYDLFELPIAITETGHFKEHNQDHRISWWRNIIAEVYKAKQMNIPVLSVFSYPIFGYRGWISENLGEKEYPWHYAGFFENNGDPALTRVPNIRLIRDVERTAQKFFTLA